MANGNRVEEFLSQNNLMAEAGVQPGQDPGFEFMTMIQNMGPSLKKNVGDFVQAVTHLPTTAQGLMGTAGGYVSKAGIPGLSQYEPYADAMNEFFVDRYGSKEAFFNTLETDPVGAVLDLSTVFTGVGGAVRGGGAAAIQGSKAGSAVNRAGQTANQAGQNIQRVANAIDPINQGLQLSYGGIGALIPESVPESLYSTGVKPGTTMSPDQRKTVLRTGVEEGVMPNQAGLNRMGALIAEYGQSVDKLIKESVDSGQSVDATSLFTDLANLEQKIMDGGSITRQADLAEVARVRGELSESIYGMGITELDASVPPKRLNAEELQKVKRSAYENANYGQRTQAPDIRNQAQQAIGRSARQQVENLTSPEITATNRRLGNLLQSQVPLERAAARIDQRNMVNLPQVVLSAPGLLSGDVGTSALGYLLGGLLSPERSARAGIGVERMRQIPRQGTMNWESLLNPALGRTTARGATYGGRLQEGLKNRGLLNR